MAIGSPQWMYASGEEYTLDQSLKFDSDNQAYLQRTFSSPTNNKIYTFSFWFKVGKQSPNSEGQRILYAGSSGSDEVGFNNDGQLQFFYNAGNSSIKTNAKYRDNSAWYHIVAVADTTQGTSSNRLKLYVNGSQVTSLATTNYPSQNQTGQINSAIAHNIGLSFSNANARIDGYLAEVNFIDGQALTPADFGETGTYGEWKPIEYSGTYGTNGFYLPFKQDYTVEGFSTVTWKGNDAANHYIGGTGFQPDFTWIKKRDAAGSHAIFDSVRGATKYLSSNQTAVESTQATTHKSWSTDGFTVGSDGASNSSSNNYVAWNWDMGSKTDTKTITGVSGGVTTTSEKKFGTASLSMQGGSNSRHYKIDDHPDWDFGSGDFTIELWIRQASNPSAYDGIISFADSSATSKGFGISYNVNGYIYFASHLGDAVSVVAHDAVLSNSTWHHIAVSRSSGTTKLFINGTEEDSATDNNHYITTPNGGYGIALGRYYPNVDEKLFHGEFDEIRISNSARYTGNFSVATSAYTTDDNTKLLMHCDGAHAAAVFKDHSASTPNTNGSITSDVAANPTYGQSIVSYTGNGAGSATVGHGLSAAPEMIFIKGRSAASGWRVDHTSLSSGKVLKLESTGAEVTDDSFGTHTSTNIALGSNGSVIDNNVTFIAYCFHSVTGYSSIGSYSGNGSSTGASVTTGFKPAWVMIKNASSSGNSWFIYDNTRNPTNRANHALAADTSAAEANYSVVDFDSNGFQIHGTYGFANDNGDTYIYMAFADKREYAYWLDQSGNNNDWTSNNLTESDISVDSPTNNFATLNPLIGTATVLSEGNLKATYTYSSGAESASPSSFALTGTGKYYCEFFNQVNNAGGVGIYADSGDNLLWVGVNANTTGHSAQYRFNGLSYINGNSNGANLPATLSGDIIGMAYDAGSGKFFLSKNGSWMSNNAGNVGNPVTGANPFFTIDSPYDAFFAFGMDENSTGIFNFGQDSSFAGNKTAQGKQDGNDIGDFYYTPPTGFLALCTKNLPDVAVTPSEHFNTVLWSGDGGSQTISGVGFQTDFTWVKSRNSSNGHHLFDSVRAFGSAKSLSSNSTQAEGAYDASYGYISSPTSDGFTASAGSSGSQYSNDASYTYVSWNWKANGSGSSNTDGTINTTATSANVDAGFSISTFNASGSATTVGHGLNQAPEMIIIKQRNGSGYQWPIYHKDIGNTKYIFLQRTIAAATDSNAWNNTSPTSTVVHLGGSGGDTNNTNGQNVMYCFHSVNGYSKVGSYIGNGNADGTFVYTGHRPSVVLVKSSSRDESWGIYDSERLGYNPNNRSLYPNLSNAEHSSTDHMDILSNGFKLYSTNHNGTGESYIFLSIAETPFKYSNGR